MPANRVKLSQIQTLTFHADQKTASRRTSPIPQLKCKGPACKHFTPEVVQCYNMGGSGGDVQWRCEAELPDGMRMGGVEVSCEGWARAGDEYVLKGSCGLEYRLVELPQYKATYGPATSKADTAQKWLFWLFFWAVAGWLVYKFLTHLFPSGLGRWRRSGGRPLGGGGGSSGGGGGGGGGWFSSFGGNGGNGTPRDAHDPPPPYPGWRPKPSPSPQPESWRPGFWTGLGLGAGAAALAGSARRRGEYDWERERYGRYGVGGMGGQWAGWGGGPERVVERVVVREDVRGPASAGPSTPRRSGGGENGTQMRTSTGYGGTNVR